MPARYSVFLSHSHHDRWIATQCARLIADAARGRVEVFLDEKDIAAGEAIAETVRTAIEGCDEFVVLLSRNSIDRPWVLMEMGAAWGLRKPIIAVTDKIGLNEMPDVIRLFKAIDLNDFDQYLTEIRKRSRGG